MELDFDFLYPTGTTVPSETQQRGKTLVTGDHEWYSPAVYVDRARKAMGGIDLDPASCEAANGVVRATSFYTAKDDGLRQPWFGKVWMNPPFGATDIAQFSEKLAREYQDGRVSQACVLVSNSTETRWFATLASVATAAVFLHQRVRFISGKNRPNRKPLQGYVVLYAGHRTDKFLESFHGLGIEMLIVPTAMEQGVLG
jgi:hypothetical protein